MQVTLYWAIPSAGVEEVKQGELKYRSRFGSSSMRSRAFFCEKCGRIWGHMYVFEGANEEPNAFVPEFKLCPDHGGRQLLPKEVQLIDNLHLVPRKVQENVFRVASEVFIRDPENFTFSHTIHLNQKDLNICLSQD